jgi:hypothetical protein
MDNVVLDQKKIQTVQPRVVQFLFAISEQRKVLEDAFEAADKNGDGVLSGSKLFPLVADVQWPML